jgi:zinc/manganese transport system substrate-binding protein
MLAAVALAVTTTGALAACGDDSASGGDGVTVVASNSIVADLTANVAGDRAEVVTLVGPGGDVHTFEPTPEDVATVSEADLVVENGLGLEPWMRDVVDSSGTGAPVVALAEAVDPIPAQEAHHDEEGHEEAGAEEEHDNGGLDPHVWQSVPNAKLMVAAARDALVAADPGGEEEYRANADAYLTRLDDLQAAVVTDLEAVPTGDRILVTSHDTFGYFGREYDFEVLGDAFASITTTGGDPSAADVAARVDEIETAGVPAIFPENVAGAGLIETVANEAGVAVAPPLYTDALGPAGSAGETYVAMMGYNAKTIADALSPTS